MFPTHNTKEIYNYSVGANDNERLNPPIYDIIDEKLSREVYSILGTPIDVIDLESVLRRMEAAASASSPFFSIDSESEFLGTGSGRLRL